MYEYDEMSRCATDDESVFEWAANCEAPGDVEWLLNDRDVWVKNPRFIGTPGPHPEDDSSWA
jgi:hypothetical protein